MSGCLLALIKFTVSAPQISRFSYEKVEKA